MGPERARSAAAEVMQQPDMALTVHAREEFGIDPDELPSAVGAAGVSLVCFLVGAFLPLIPWFLGGGAAAAWASLAIGLVAAAIVGGLVGKFAERSIPASITRQVLIVLIACTITYVIGDLAGFKLG
jgi:VIT1/CCC1 family predicted Fe2+/Mn2+ transporter